MDDFLKEIEEVTQEIQRYTTNRCCHPTPRCKFIIDAVFKEIISISVSTYVDIRADLAKSLSEKQIDDVIFPLLKTFVQTITKVAALSIKTSMEMCQACVESSRMEKIEFQ